MSSATPTLLIIDDNERLLASYQTFFSEEGLEVITALEGKHGVELAAKCQPGVIILDLMLPGMDGLEVLKHLKSDAATKHIPVIVLTALVNELEKKASLDGGAVEYIEKVDVNPSQLLSHVRKALKSQESAH